MSNTDSILIIIAIILILKDFTGENYKNELNQIKKELSNISNKISKRGDKE